MRIKKRGGREPHQSLKKKQTQKTISRDTIESNKGTNSSLKIGTYANFKHWNVSIYPKFSVQTTSGIPKGPSWKE